MARRKQLDLWTWLEQRNSAGAVTPEGTRQESGSASSERPLAAPAEPSLKGGADEAS